ncbi:hypothetical protein FQA39_LY17490 [Lamprigera yunnana]|nr:hypothetical protein FQA39_LY17490 [Lamprigera yunnana]
MYIYVLIFLFLTRNGICLDLSNQLRDELFKFRTSGESRNLRNVIDSIFENTDNNAYCTSCNVVVDYVINYRKSGTKDNEVADFLKRICPLFTNNNEKSCSGFIDIVLDSWLYIIDNKNVTSKRACSIYFQNKNCQDVTYVPWQIKVPQRVSKVVSKNREGKVQKILHLTDIHYDPLYEPGSNGQCKEVLCCESDSGEPKNKKDAAGFWGDYHVCDMPWHSIQNLLNDIKERHNDIDWIYFTGDIVSHRVWATSRKENAIAIKTFLQGLKDTFGDIPVYPILGNHEAHPVDLFPPLNVNEDLSMKWLYELVADEWSRWIPKESMQDGGYYTVLVKPGFRIIALNSNVCFTNNAWLVYDDEDPFGQLQWLADTLLEAESNSEVVHILSHVPPGEEQCAIQWSHEFKRIIERFHHIITGQFNGHTHYDEFKVFYDPKDPNTVINIAINGGSFTSFIALNPNYKIYLVEEEFKQVLDFDTWTYHLSEANKNNTKPKWYKLYSFTDAFQLGTFKETNVHDLLKRMSSDSSLLDKYQRFRVRNSNALLQEEYEKNFLHKVLCEITAVEYINSTQCKIYG